MKLRIPRKFKPLLFPYRYKGIYGGRGSAKSWSVGDTLLMKGMQQSLGIMMCREYQNSTKESSKRLLENKIKHHGLENFYRPTNTEIIGANGTYFLFYGLRRNVGSIQSTEGIDIAVVEEAQHVSQSSLDILVPTIRKALSEIWCIWNPRFKDDPVDALFRGDAGPPPRSALINANWYDNPFFPDVLRDEMEWMRERDPEKYAHIWGGGYVAMSEARVFRRWSIGTMEVPEGAIPHYGVDWGFSIDPMVLVRLWVLPERRIIYIDRERWGMRVDIDNMPQFFADLDENEVRRWPIVADSARPELISHMRKNGYPKIVPAKKGAGSVEEGVAFMQSYDIVVHPDCHHVIDEMTHYSHKVDKKTDQVLPVLADADNNVIDACRYALEGERANAGPQIFL